MKKVSPAEIIKQVLLANNFENHDHTLEILYRGDVRRVIFQSDLYNFTVEFLDFKQGTSKEYIIPINSHQSINKVLDRIELLTNKKLKTPVFKI